MVMETAYVKLYLLAAFIVGSLFCWPDEAAKPINQTETEIEELRDQIKTVDSLRVQAEQIPSLKKRKHK